MALKPYLSFSSGELDPILHDNATLEKFNKGLATARNVIVSKTGSIMSRFSREHVRKSLNDNERIVLHEFINADNSRVLIEFGPLYARIGSGAPLVTPYSASSLSKLQFLNFQNHIYVFCEFFKVIKIAMPGFTLVPEADIFAVPNPLTSLGVVQTGGSTAYKVDYLATLVINGQESLPVSNVTGFNKPVTTAHNNLITVVWPTASVASAEVSQVRIYSRPNGGGAYGFLGATSKITTAGANQEAKFDDIGQLPDFTNGVPDLITKYGLGGKAVIDMRPRTGTIYQQRLIITDNTDKEALVASRPGHQNNFFRDFPYDADSALKFKSGTSGRANVLRFTESDGLIVFTTIGVFTHGGLLSIDNLALTLRGSWIIKDNLPPLVVPGGVFFVDRTNTIRQLIFSQEIQAYESLEQTIFSNHLFQEKEIVSWCYQDGLVPVIIVVFSDGTFATFTYNFEHQMKAWTRHDSKYPVEFVCASEEPDVSYFVINKNGNRYIEKTHPRNVILTDFFQVGLSSVPGRDISFIYKSLFMDSFKSQLFILSTNSLTPVTPGVWDGPLTWTQSDDLPEIALGTVWRWFHPVTRNYIDLEVTAVNIPTVVYTVQPSEEFPSEYGNTNIPIYQTYNTVTGLAHLEGEQVSVMVDGTIVSSPNNDVEGYPVLTVSGGSLTLPDDLRGAIIHVGRPITADIATLNISTVEQSPTLLESLNVNKLYIRVNDTRGLYCSNKFPEEFDGEKNGSSVAGMEALDEQYVPLDDIIIGNAAPATVTKRLEKTIPGSWDSQGKISIRQVDPYHFEILSIIPDLTVLGRSDR